MSNKIGFYDLDRQILSDLTKGATDKKALKKWQSAASGIAEYVSSWGMERFWAMSRSLKLLNGKMPAKNITPNREERLYFAWDVARVILCRIIGTDLQIQANMTTEQFQKRFQELNFNQQMLMTELLLEIADTIQFWTMRLKDAVQSGSQT